MTGSIIPFGSDRQEDPVDHSEDGRGHGSQPERTLILEIALPDYYLDDWDEILAFYEGEEDTLGAIANESGLCSYKVNLSILVGDKGGTFVERVNGQILAAKVVPRVPEHELEHDRRLDDLDSADPADDPDDSSPSVGEAARTDNRWAGEGEEEA